MLDRLNSEILQKEKDMKRLAGTIENLTMQKQAIENLLAKLEKQ